VRKTGISLYPPHAGVVTGSTAIVWTVYRTARVGSGGAQARDAGEEHEMLDDTPFDVSSAMTAS
jgi:hypothetical protein